MVITFKKEQEHVIGKNEQLGGHEEIHGCMSGSENAGCSSQHSSTVPLWTGTSAHPIPLSLKADDGQGLSYLLACGQGRSWLCQPVHINFGGSPSPFGSVSLFSIS